MFRCQPELDETVDVPPDEDCAIHDESDSGDEHHPSPRIDWCPSALR
jgi:hypothetical protein